MPGRNGKCFGVSIAGEDEKTGIWDTAGKASRTPNGSVRILSREILYKGFVQLEKVTVEQTTADGRILRYDREIHDHGSAAAILLYDPKRDTVIMVRQLRLPAYLLGDSGFMIEVPAGLLDGDAADQAIAREAMEETGYKVGAVRHLFDAFMAPGAVTERVSFFVGLIDAADKAAAGGGLAEEHEEIEVLEIGFGAAYAMIATGEICDAKTIMLLQWAMLNRASLAG